PDRDDDWLVLSTIHSAKGQERSAGYVLNAVDGSMPPDMAPASAAEIEEERRLLYVAMTRAKAHLSLVVPQRFYVHQQPAGGDRYLHALLTRFIPESLHDRFRELVPFAAGERAACAPPTAAEATPAIDLGARVRARWA